MHNLVEWWLNIKFADRIAVASLLVSFITLIFMARLTIIGINLAAKPRIKMKYSPSVIDAQQETDIKFYFENVGRWFAKPAVTNLTLYINFPLEFHLEKFMYGSNLEKTETDILRGKNNSKYIKATGIHLHYREPGEEVQIYLVAPLEPGRYKGWVSAEFNERDLEVHNFTINVTANELMKKHPLTSEHVKAPEERIS